MLAAHAINMLGIRFTDAFWSQLLTELKASDVFANRISDVGSLHDAIQGATILNPANLEITAADWRAAEPYAPGPAGGGANALARAALLRVRFFSLLDITRFDYGPGAVLPFSTN
jgi:hypothetical protein